MTFRIPPATPAVAALVAVALVVGCAQNRARTAVPEPDETAERTPVEAPETAAAEAEEAAADTVADPAGIFPFPVHETRLDNGLDVVAIPYDSPGIVAYFTVVRTGSREEVEPGHSGFAHFFEHMMFRGTETYSADEYNDVLKRLGADSNAFTTDDYTNYYIIGPSAELETIMEIEADRFQNLEYGEDVFRTEALAVLGEYNKNASSPFLPMFERLRELAFDEHTYEHTTMGFLDDIRAMPGYYDYSLSFFDRFYRPENTVLLVVGDVDPERVAELAELYYGDWEPGYRPPEIPPAPPQEELATAHIDWPTPIRPNLMMGWRAPAFDTDTLDTAALHLVGELLFSESAPLYQKLVVEEQWVDDLSGGMDDRRDPYLFTFSAQLRSEEAIPKVREAIGEAARDLKRRPVDAERLERIQRHLRYDFALGLDSPGSVAFTVAHYLNLTGDPDSINRLYANFQEVTPEDVQRVAREVFDESRLTVVTLAHDEDEDETAATAGEVDDAS